MACAIHPAPETGGDAATGAAPLSALMPAAPRAMTGCECAGVTFQEIARQMAAGGSSLDEACQRTRCGQTCTACLPDLVKYLSSR